MRKFQEKSDHSMFYEIERRFLAEKNVDEWTESDDEAYDFLCSIIERLETGEGVFVSSDPVQVEFSKKFKSALKSLYNKNE